MNHGKLSHLMKTFINTQIQYCPLAWIFQSRKLNQEIHKVQERALRITYNYQDYESSYDVLMEKDRSLTVHQGNVQIFMNEMYQMH